MHSSFQKILFFDIGGVLLSNGWGHESREAAARHFGFDYTEMKLPARIYF
jgi:putative hydrolase of the HAD superfamily